MKYIMFEQEIGEIKRKIPFIFPNFLVHQDVAAVTKVLLDETFKNSKNRIVSAGDVQIGAGATINCSGKSETLKIKSHPDDTQILTMYDYFHGVQI